ncbi:bifunctional precorrin-2 dehydrogenase/sirohydrochlorin ferrochelatase [Qipengyuania sp. JC766]|uniref:precorrin-2 dehydrogenase/sirohydrochlorin ferrochelatase family protein n=1 Tax=Qipengyuania sp. JC766 TaxID=3232139 RepID=UPI00345B0011
MAGIGSLPLFHRIAGTRVVLVAEGDMGDAKRRLIERAGGIPCGEAEAHYAKLAFVALDDAKDAEKAALRLKRMGLLVNVADRPELCDFTTPSILDREPVLVAVSTSGASAGLAKQLRLRLETLLPQSLGRLATRLNEERERLRARWPDGQERRGALDAALTSGGPLDPMQDGADERFDDWLSDTDHASAPEVRTIELASADPDDLTIRQARWLGTADTIVHDPDVPAAILARARADAARIPASDPRDPMPGLTVILRGPDQAAKTAASLSAK